MRAIRRLLPALLVLTAFPSAVASAGDERAVGRLRFTGGAGLNAYLLDGAFFGAPGQPRPDGSYGWLEAVGRAGLACAVSDRVSLRAGLAGVFTFQEDPFGVSDRGTALVESATLAVTDLLTPGLDVTVGRQQIMLGDGFLLEDGYADRKAAIWSIPLTFWDAARLSYRRGDLAGNAFVARLSSSCGRGGALYGLDVAWTPGPKTGEAGTQAAADEAPKTYVGLSGLARRDSGEADDDAAVLSLRASVPLGPVTLAGEYALQGGERHRASLGGEAWHADARWDLPLELSPYLLVSRLRFSGDDPASADDETFLWRSYGGTDWSRYYLGEIAGSSVLANTDLAVLKLEGGLSIEGGLSLRLFYLDLRTDTGAFWGVPEGAGDRLARELDAVLTFTPGEVVELWLLVGQARPGRAGTALWGARTSNLLSAGFSWSF